MQCKFILAIFLVSVAVSDSLAFGIRTIKGIVVSNDNEVLIGASVVENDNLLNNTLTNIKGEFELSIPDKEMVVIQISYGCSAFYDILYEISRAETFVTIVAYAEETDQNTNRIRV